MPRIVDEGENIHKSDSPEGNKKALLPGPVTKLTSGRPCWILAIEAGQTDSGLRKASNHPCLGEVSQGVQPEHLDNLCRVVLVGDEFVRIGKVDAVETAVPMRRATHQHVDLFGTGFTDGSTAVLTSGSSDNGIIHQDHPLVPNHFGDEIEFHVSCTVPSFLLGQDETSSHVVVADIGQDHWDPKSL